MRQTLAILAAAAALLAGAVAAAPLKLTPADPQPRGLKPGLSVLYAYPADVKSLTDARAAIKRKSVPGAPLAGLDHRDTDIGESVLTAERAEKVVAQINGFVRFDAPGNYTVDFLTNDGLQAVVGGQVVGRFDGRQACSETFAVEVQVPKAGWYPVDVLWFQRTKTACLHMRAGPQGKRVTWMPDAAFGH